MTATTGVATYPVSLTVAVGDVIGVWCSGGTAQIRSYFDGAIGVVDVTRDFSTVAKPTPGSTQVNSGAVADHSLALRAS